MHKIRNTSQKYTETSLGTCYNSRDQTKMFSATLECGNYSHLPNMRRCMLVMGLNDPQAINTTCLLELMVDQTHMPTVHHTHHNTVTNINRNILSPNMFTSVN